MKKPKKTPAQRMRDSIQRLIPKIEALQDKAFGLSRKGDEIVDDEFDEVEGFMNDAAAALESAVELLEHRPFDNE